MAILFCPHDRLKNACMDCLREELAGEKVQRARVYSEMGKRLESAQTRANKAEEHLARERAKS